MLLASATDVRLVSEGLHRQHRAEDLVLDDLRVVRAAARSSVGSYHSPSSAGDVSTAQHPVARRARPLHESIHPSEVVGVDQRRDRGLGRAAVAQHVFVGEGENLREERIANRRFHQQSRAGHAHLPRVVVLARGLAGGGVEIGVGEHDERALTAELRGEGDDVAGGGGADVARGLGRAGEGDSAAPVGSEISAAPTSSPIPWTMLNTPGGNPASSTRSASTEALTGDHSAGLSTTVLPAARAGAHFQVESMNGAFHGVMITAGPAGMRTMLLAVPFELQVRPSYSPARSA